MRIGIIGAGHVGSTLAKRFVMAGHEVAVANSRGPQTLGDLENQLGEHGRAVTAEHAAEIGDVVVISIPFGRFRELSQVGTDGKTVIDTNNYYPERDGHFPELDEDRTTSSELLQAHLPQAHVVKAFNAMRWDHLRDYGRPRDTTRYAIPFSGDDQDARREAASLIDQTGFDAVYAGTLAEGGRKHQPDARVYAADLTADELSEQLEQAEPDERWTEAAGQARTSSDPRARTPHDRRGTPTTGTATE